MKFDCIIMNPPYQRNLHLKILEKAIEQLKDDDSICVNLSPDTHLKSPAVWNDWNKNNLCEFTYSHMASCEYINHNDANKIFKLGNGIDSLHVGLYTRNIYNTMFPHRTILPICKKIFSIKPNLRNKFIRKEQLSEFGIRVYRYRTGTNVYNSIICEEGKAVEGIDFENITQLTNFKLSISCWPYNFMYCLGDTNPAHLPFMGEAINPRTGLKGYESEWTDEDFYTYFNITKDEQKIIEETV